MTRTELGWQVWLGGTLLCATLFLCILPGWINAGLFLVGIAAQVYGFVTAATREEHGNE